MPIADQQVVDQVLAPVFRARWRFDEVRAGFEALGVLAHPGAGDILEELHYEVMDAEQFAEEHLGFEECPKCKEWALKTWTRPTRNYGGGLDSFERCSHCGHADVFV